MSDLTERIKKRVVDYDFYFCATNGKIDIFKTEKASKEEIISIIDEEAAKEKEETCKWIKIDDEHWSPSCESNAEYGVIDVVWFRVCPYCGRKIEVIE